MYTDYDLVTFELLLQEFTLVKIMQFFNECLKGNALQNMSKKRFTLQNMWKKRFSCIFLQFANEKPEIIASSNQGNTGAGFSEDNMIKRIYDSAT